MMNFKTFLIGMAVVFGLPFVFAIVVPYANMANLEPVYFTEAADGFDGVYDVNRSGRTDGAAIYAANGCAVCHTQLIRPSYAGSEIHRSDWAGQKADAKNGIPDTRRETNAYDFAGEKFAHIGQGRVGPDLSNLAIRVKRYAKEEGVTSKDWLLSHLYDPRKIHHWSVCPSTKFLFTTTKTPNGQQGAMIGDEGQAVTPKVEALALVDYLLSMKKDDVIPAAVNPRKPQN